MIPIDGKRWTYLSPTDQGGDGGGGRKSNLSPHQHRAFTQRVLSQVREFIQTELKAQGFNKVDFDYKVNALQLTIKKPVWKFWGDPKTPSKEVIEQIIESLNSALIRSGLGSIVSSGDIASGKMSFVFHKNADDTTMHNHFHSKRFFGKQLACAQYPENRVMNKKQAFLLHRAQSVIEGYDASVYLTADFKETGTLVAFFDSGFFAHHFIDNLSPDLKRDFALELDVDPEQRERIYLHFNPDWDSDSYRDYQKVLTDQRLHELESYYDVIIEN